MKSKTIIISAPENSSTNGRGILTVYQDNNILNCRLRLYNIKNLTQSCKIGIYHQNQVYTSEIAEKNGAYESSLIGNFDIDKDFYMALIDTSNANNVILCGGTYSGMYFNNTSVFSKEDSEEEVLCKTQECDKCLNCKYKQFFYNQTENNSIEVIGVEQEDEKLLENEKDQVIEESKKGVDGVINSIIPQFEYIFEHYSLNEELNMLINDSKFVKIDENQNEYSIGAIYEEEKLKYICYAVKRNYNQPVPNEIGEYYQWLPIDKEDPLSDGYYIVFQDANDLKILKI